MSEIDQLFQEFPPGVRERLRSAWDGMPDVARRPLTRALRELPADLGRWRELMRLALSHARLVTGDKRRVAIVGPANVGKSTLYNQLVRNAADRAEVSAVPGTTRTSARRRRGPVRGRGHARRRRGRRRGRGREGARPSPPRARPTSSSSSSTRSRESSGRSRSCSASSRPSSAPTWWCSTRSTSWPGRASASGCVEAAARNLGLAADEVVPCVAKDGQHVERVLLAVAKAEPEIVAALGAALPEYRALLAWSATKKAGATAAAIALAPLPILDVVPLLAVQASLVLGIARIYAPAHHAGAGSGARGHLRPRLRGPHGLPGAVEARRTAGVGPGLGHRRLDDGRDRPRRRRLVRARGAGDGLRAQSREPLAREADAAVAPGAGPAPTAARDVRQAVEATLVDTPVREG